MCEHSNEQTFELVCLFVSDQSDAADVEFFEDGVDVTLHRVERQVSHVHCEWRLRWQLLLLPRASRAATTTTSTGANGGGRQRASQTNRFPLLRISSSVHLSTSDSSIIVWRTHTKLL